MSAAFFVLVVGKEWVPVAEVLLELPEPVYAVDPVSPGAGFSSVLVEVLLVELVFIISLSAAKKQGKK